MTAISTPAKVPIVQFSTEDLPPEDRYDAWHDSMGSLFELAGSSDRTEGRDFKGGIVARDMGQGLLGVTQAQAEVFRRDSKRIARDGMDHILVQVYLKGGAFLDDGRRIEAGDMLVVDLDQEFRITTEDFVNLSLLLPRDLLSGLSDRLAALHGQKLDRMNPMVRFVSDHMRALWRHVPDMTVDQAGAAIEGTVSVLEGWLSREDGAPVDASLSTSAAIRKSICRYIDRHIADPMTPESLAAEFRISRSQIYRMFALDNGVARYILERRLRRSARMLTLPVFNRMSIGAICFSSGFSSESQFSKAFRKRYGVSPTTARATGQARVVDGGATGSGHMEFMSWIRHLSGPV